MATFVHNDELIVVLKLQDKMVEKIYTQLWERLR